MNKRHHLNTVSSKQTLPLPNLTTNLMTPKILLPYLFVGISCVALLLISFQSVGQSLTQSPQSFNNLQANNLVNPQPLDGNSFQRTLNVDSRRQVEAMQQEIEKIESEQGAWGTGLAEQLAGLGKTYQLRGEHELAIETFERAIHVNRINQGLYDLSQVSLIEDMLDSLMVTGKWEDVHERQQYLYWIHQRNYGEKDPRMLPVIDRLGSWYINDYALNPGHRVVDNLVDAYDLFNNASSIVEEQYGPADLRMIVPLRGLVLSNWFLWTYASQNPSSAFSNNQFSGEISSVNSLSGNPNRLAPYVRNNYANGKAALSRIIEIYDENPDAPPGASATTKVELADWHMLSNRWRSATDLYKEAYASLNGDEQTHEQAVKIFERPVALPDLELMESDVEQYSRRSSQTTTAPSSYVLVSFDVSRFGEARNINIVESQPEDNVGIRAQVKRSLSGTRFRPRIVNGEPVDSEGLIHKYVFN